MCLCSAPASGASHGRVQPWSFFSQHHASSCESRQGGTSPPQHSYIQELLCPGAGMCPQPSILERGFMSREAQRQSLDVMWCLLIHSDSMMLPKGGVSLVTQWEAGGTGTLVICLCALGPLTRSNQDQTPHFKGSPEVCRPFIPSSD